MRASAASALRLHFILSRRQTFTLIMTRSVGRNKSRGLPAIPFIYKKKLLGKRLDLKGVLDGFFFLFLFLVFAPSVLWPVYA